ncbi:hypothetical protein GCK32_010008 [Trichostrongylus colubriformis]|uniref:Uncharacterized protein n=1 Tax=Trichostrongylus colubriformis TaxID=6319 RepID=A0AAN8IDZ3_TRICO
MLGNIFITVNRYAAICLMQRYDTLWMKRNVWTAIGIQYVVSFCCSVYVLTAKLVYIHNDDGTTILKGYERHIDVVYIYWSLCYLFDSKRDSKCKNGYRMAQIVQSERFFEEPKP